MALHVLAGLEHLHAQRIIHGDLKPSNILLKYDTAQLADFGVACILNADSFSRVPKGTPAYMAPEAFCGECNEQTDIWSVGVILYEMLAGWLPYEPSDRQALRDAIKWSDPPPLPAFVPEALRRAVGRALRRDASQRYQSAAEMRRELLALSHDLLLPHLLPTLENGEPDGAERRSLPPGPPPHAAHNAVPETRAAGRPLSIAVLLLLVVLAVGAVLTASLSPAAPVTVLSPDGKSVAQARGNNVTLKNLVSKEPPYYLANYDNPSPITRLQFSPDGKTLAGARGDNVVLLWDDVKTGARPRELRWHTGPVEYFVFWFDVRCPEEQMLVSVGSEVVLWKLKSTEKPLHVFPWYKGFSVYTVAFSPDGRMLTSQSGNNALTLWDADTGEPIRNFTVRGDIYAVEFSDGGLNSVMHGGTSEPLR